MKKSLSELRQDPSRTAWRSRPVVGSIVVTIIAVAMGIANFLLRDNDESIWLYPVLLILIVSCIGGYGVYSFRRIIRFLDVGLLTEAEVNEKGISMKGLSDLKFQYEHGGVIYQTSKSVASSEANSGVKSGVMFILIDPNQPKKYIFVDSLYGLE